MRIGVVILPEFRAPAVEEIWRRAEEVGFDHAWTYDHLAWRSLRDSTWFATIPTLTVAAMVTKRIRLGILVASPNFRHPVPFAKELMTLDDVSGGRFILGIGAGGTNWDATILGQAPWSQAERADRFVEFVGLTDQLLREPATSYKGRFYSANEARNYPGCVQHPRIPFAIAATGPRGMRLAVQYGQAWVTVGDRTPTENRRAAEGAAVVREQILRLESACAEHGRNPTSLDRIVLSGAQLDPGLESVGAFQDTIGCYAAAGVTDFVVHWPRHSAPYAGEQAAFERIVSTVLSARENAPIKI